MEVSAAGFWCVRSSGCVLFFVYILRGSEATFVGPGQTFVANLNLWGEVTLTFVGAPPRTRTNSSNKANLSKTRVLKDLMSVEGFRVFDG